jgi:ribonuclease P protein component
LPPAPWAASLLAAQEGCLSHEENISAAQQEAREQARISGAHEHPMGPGCAESAAQEGAKAPDGVGALEARRALRPEGLPRSWRLTRRSDLAVVQREGRRHRTPRLDIAWRGNSHDHPRVGVIVPRYGRSNVARNRLRRRLREILRRRVLSVAGSVDLVVRSRPTAFDAALHQLASDLESWVHSSST